MSYFISPAVCDNNWNPIIASKQEPNILTNTKTVIEYPLSKEYINNISSKPKSSKINGKS